MAYSAGIQIDSSQYEVSVTELRGEGAGRLKYKTEVEKAGLKSKTLTICATKPMLPRSLYFYCQQFIVVIDTRKGKFLVTIWPLR